MEKAYSKLSGVKSASVSLCEIAVALLCGSCSHYPSCLKPWHRSRMAFKQQYAKSLGMVVLMESK